MKRLLTAFVFAASLFALSAAAEEMTGIITDAKCKHTDTSAKSVACAKACIKAGQPAVFNNSADQTVYTISNPDKIESHVGQRVTVNGNVQGDSLTVESVKKAASSGM